MLKEESKFFDKDKILSNDEQRVSNEFEISPDFKDRVSFWFDIYTKYSSQENVIHHSLYPWIVYRVVDLRPILNEPGNKWAKYHRAERYAKKQTTEIRDILRRLLKRKSFSRLNDPELEIFDLIRQIPGFKLSLAKKFLSEALRNVRTQVGQKDFIQNGLESSALYLPELERVFADKGLPLELTRLPFVESSFNVRAVSKVGASGVWQMMPYIGKKFLIMNNAVDERNSPIKSAVAAAYLLKQNKQILKNWPLALTAYNHGAGSLSKAAKKYHSFDLQVLIKKFKSSSFGFASQNFYASFLAILYAEKYKDKIFDDSLVQAPSLQFVQVKLSKPTRIKELLSLSGMTADEFQKYNLDIRKYTFKQNLKLPRGYVLHVPQKAAADLLTKSKVVASAEDSYKSFSKNQTSPL